MNWPNLFLILSSIIKVDDILSFCPKTFVSLWRKINHWIGKINHFGIGPDPIEQVHLFLELIFRVILDHLPISFQPRRFATLWRPVYQNVRVLYQFGLNKSLIIYFTAWMESFKLWFLLDLIKWVSVAFQGWKGKVRFFLCCECYLRQVLFCEKQKLSFLWSIMYLFGIIKVLAYAEHEIADCSRWESLMSFYPNIEGGLMMVISNIFFAENPGFSILMLPSSSKYTSSGIFPAR